MATGGEEKRGESEVFVVLVFLFFYSSRTSARGGVILSYVCAFAVCAVVDGYECDYFGRSRAHSADAPVTPVSDFRSYCRHFPSCE